MRHRPLARLLALTSAAVFVLLGVSVESASARPGSTTYASLGRSTITLGETVAVRSAVTPNQAGRTVYLQKHSVRGWTTLQQRTLSGASRATFSLKPGTAGKKYLRVFYRGHAARSGSLSRTVVLTVRPRPSGGGGTGGSCTAGYSPCIPVGSDVDCRGGSGNGPRYVDGPIYVTGSDPYGLDGDGDGVACED